MYSRRKSSVRWCTRYRKFRRQFEIFVKMFSRCIIRVIHEKSLTTFCNSRRKSSVRRCTRYSKFWREFEIFVKIFTRSIVRVTHSFVNVFFKGSLNVHSEYLQYSCPIVHEKLFLLFISPIFNHDLEYLHSSRNYLFLFLSEVVGRIETIRTLYKYKFYIYIYIYLFTNKYKYLLTKTCSLFSHRKHLFSLSRKFFHRVCHTERFGISVPLVPSPPAITFFSPIVNPRELATRLSHAPKTVHSTRHSFPARCWSLILLKKNQLATACPTRTVLADQIRRFHFSEARR